MRLYTTLLLWMVLLTASLPVTAAEHVRVGIYENLPKVGLNESGKSAGIFVDIIEAIAAKEGWTLEYVPGSWSEGLDRLAAGQIDLMPDVAHTAERDRQYDFHDEPALSSWFQVYARKGSGIRSITDLSGRSALVLERSVQQTAFEQLVDSFGFKVTLIPSADLASMFERVAAGEADAAITNRYYGLRYGKKYGLEETAVIFHPSSLHFAAPAGKSGALLRAIDHHLVAMKKDPQSAYYHSLNRWTSEQVEFSLPEWVRWAAAVGIVFLLASTFWIVTLRRTAVRLRESEQRQRSLAEELERSMAELAETTHFLDTILDHISSPIFYKGADLRFRGCNRAYEKAFGVTREKFIGKTVLDLEYLPLAQRGAYQAEDAEAMAAASTVSREAVIPFVDGREHQTLYSVSGFRALDGSPGGLVGIIVDITPLKEAEEALRKAKHAAEAADRLKSAFLATMSHELRTPLNSIIGFTGIVLQELPGPLNGEQKKQLGMVRDSARHLLSLINDVLDISKIEAGELKVAHEPLDLKVSVEKVVGIVAPLAEKKGLALQVSSVERTDTITGDVRRVEQILMNLLSNAIKFTETGSVTLTVEQVADHAGASMRLRVADTGIGIRPEDMAMLFQPFRQVDSALSRQHEGTGLGLAICHRLAALMGGRIEAESRFGEGSAFTLFLPLYQPPNKEVS